MGLMVSSGPVFFSEEKRQTIHQIEALAAGMLAFKLTNTSQDGRYRIVKEILADPKKDVVMQNTRFSPLRGNMKNHSSTAFQLCLCAISK